MTWSATLPSRWARTFTIVPFGIIPLVAVISTVSVTARSDVSDAGPSGELRKYDPCTAEHPLHEAAVPATRRSAAEAPAPVKSTAAPEGTLKLNVVTSFGVAEVVLWYMVISDAAVP